VERLLGVPVASEIVVHARQELVKRLDSYELESRELFSKVIAFMERKRLPRRRGYPSHRCAGAL
jgi:adenylate kinase